jgi:simple sugar transport system permease protein
MDVALVTGILQSMLAMAIPLLLAAEGELLAEKAGVINIGIEGLILAGALAAMTAAYFTGSALLALPAAWAAGLLLSMVFSYAVVARGGNQVVAGIAINLLALGLTGVAYRAVFGITGAALTVSAIEPMPVPILSAIPLIGPSLFNQTMLGYVAFAFVPLIAFGLYRTLPGLRLRMVGESPAAALAQGVNPKLTQSLAVLACGLFASTAGAYLVVAYARTFVEGMSAGRGFIALAIVIFGRWSPWGIVIGASLFGLATALQFHIQALGFPIPYQFALMMPYVLTLIVLAGYAGSAAAPAHLGVALDPEE